MTSKNRKIGKGTLFEDRVGSCTIAMCLDKRHPDSENSKLFPLCIRFTIYDSRYYYRLGEKCSYEDLDKLCSDILKIVELTNCCDAKTLKVLKTRKLMINRGRH